MYSRALRQTASLSLEAMTATSKPAATSSGSARASSTAKRSASPASSIHAWTCSRPVCPGGPRPGTAPTDAFRARMRAAADEIGCPLTGL